MANPAPTQRLPSVRRVRRRGEFKKVFDNGIRLHGRYITMILLATDNASPRLGIVASRKLGNAVARNRAKRLIREMFRRTVPDRSRPVVDLVVIPRRDLLEAPFESLSHDFSGVWRRAASRVSAHVRG